MLIAGWVHYLAFDLFIGVWIAERLDAERLSRWIQTPILIATFLFGPLGLLLGIAPGAFIDARRIPISSAQGRGQKEI